MLYITAGVIMTAVGLLALEDITGQMPVPALVGRLPLLLRQSVNPNEVGGIITLFLPLIVAGWAGTWAFPEQRSLKKFALWLLPALFLGGVLLFTASFSAIMGVFVGCSVVLLLVNRKTRLLLLPIGALVLLSAIVVRASPVFDRLALAMRLTWNSSIITRATIWSQAQHSVQDFPLLGTGLGSFRYVAPVLYPFSESAQDLVHAHNLYLQAALDFGFLGGLMFAAMWIVLMATLMRTVRAAGKTESDLALRVLAIGLLGSLVAHAIYSLFDALAPGARPGFVLWYLFGLSAAVGATSMRSRGQYQHQLFAAAALFLLSSAVLIWLFLPLQRASSETAHALLTESQNIEDASPLVAQVAQERCRAGWHLGLLEHERGNFAARDLAWQQLLGCSTQHTALMRSLAPENRTLAVAAIATHPEDAEGYFWLADLEAEDDPGAAITLYEQGLTFTPRNGVRLVELGEVREAAGDVDGALKAYDQACFLVDLGVNGCPHAGHLYLAVGSYELAEERFRMALDQAPGYLPTQRGLADALLAMGHSEEAVPYLTILADQGDREAQEQLQELTRGE